MPSNKALVTAFLAAQYGGMIQFTTAFADQLRVGLILKNKKSGHKRWKKKNDIPADNCLKPPLKLLTYLTPIALISVIKLHYYIPFSHHSFSFVIIFSVNISLVQYICVSISS